MRPTGRIHAAKLSKSDRLTAFLAFLRLHPGASTREIQTGADVCNPNTAASELRSLGYTVTCEFERVTESGRRIHRYRLQEVAQ